VSDPSRLSRRRLLRGVATGAAVGAGSLIGTGGVAATPTDRYVVGTDGQRATGVARERAASVSRVLDFGDIGSAVTGRFPEEALKGLEKRPDVRYVEADGRMQAVGQTTPWGIDRTDANALHDSHAGGGAHVAVLDSGIDSDHPDLQSNLGAGKAFVSCDGSNGNDCHEPWDDDNDHGTHCAGIAAAVDDSSDVIGMAPAATLHAVKVLESNGWGSYSDIAAGIEHVADRGWDVASLSLGGDKSHTLEDACEYAASKGVLLVAAAGNNGPCTDCVLYPAAEPEVIAVSATDAADDLAYFSSTGPEVELAAPGEGILSTVPGGTARFSGTSMACPHVSGAGALLMADGDTASEARDKLGNTAEDIGLGDNESGNGLLDAEAAVGGSGGGTDIGEVGTVTFTQPSDGDWFSESFQGTYTDPVVVMKNPSFNGNQPVHVRLRNVTDNGFEYQMEEWQYLDDTHAEETISYVVFERGQHTLDDGTAVEAGTVETTSSWTSVGLSNSFSSAPVVLSASQTHNGYQAIVTRNRNVSTSGFGVKLQEEEANGWHKTETVGYVAVEPGPGTTGDGAFEAVTGTGVSSGWRSIAFDTSFGSAPQLVADMQTTNGANTADVRKRKLSADGVELCISEERSHDDETWHNEEAVGYLAVSPGTTLL